jgi:O-antigen/teichoic acid export membrane protein
MRVVVRGVGEARAERGSGRLVIKRFILSDAVFAYLDPGTGSMLVQLVVGGVAAAAVTAKFYWRRLLRLLRIRKTEPESDRER